VLENGGTGTSARPYPTADGRRSRSGGHTRRARVTDPAENGRYGVESLSSYKYCSQWQRDRSRTPFTVALAHSIILSTRYVKTPVAHPCRILLLLLLLFTPDGLLRLQRPRVCSGKSACPPHPVPDHSTFFRCAFLPTAAVFFFAHPTISGPYISPNSESVRIPPLRYGKTPLRLIFFRVC